MNITWFDDSPDAGAPACVCSLCGERISEDEAPVFRMFNNATNQEARFHYGCFAHYHTAPRCPHCQAAIDVSNRAIGDRVFHPACGQWYLVTHSEHGAQLVACAAPATWPRERRKERER